MSSVAPEKKVSVSRVSKKRRIEPQSSSTLGTTSQKRMKIEDETKVTSSSEKPNIPSLELKKFSQVKVKKDEALMLAEPRGAQYLEGATTLTINPPALRVTFSRQFLSETHGGSVQEFLACSKDKSRLFVFPTSDVNPWMPYAPGSPGLLLSCRKALTEQNCTLVSRVEKSPARWMYFGEYRCVVVGKLTPQEFAQQRQQVKSTWGKKLLKAKKSPEYVQMRTRILSRKRQRAPRSSNELTIADVIASLEAGEEQIDVVRMNCISYDHEFAESLNSAISTWTPKNTKKAKAKAKETKKYGRVGAQGAQLSDGSADGDNSAGED